MSKDPDPGDIQRHNKEPRGLAAEICDHYCKFPEAYDTGHDDDNDRMIEEKCNSCPLGELVK